MKDWKLAAKASGIDAPEKDLAQLAQPLEALEAVFRPLAQDLEPALEPILRFEPEADAE